MRMGLDAAVYAKASEVPLLEVRLGNISLVGYVREHLLKAGIDLGGPLWFTVKSGSHTGDEISFERVATLQAEIEVMFQLVQDPEVRDFLQLLRRVADAARANETSICFE